MADYDTSIRVNTDVDSSDLRTVQREFDRISNQLRELHEKKKQLEQSGVDKQSDEWKNLMSQIEPLETQYESMKKQLDGMTDAAGNAAKTLKDIKNKLLGIVTGVAVFKAMCKVIETGLLALISAVKEGFKNMAQYSADYNRAMSDMKSEAAQLKNSLAAAFEPVVTKIIPYITMFLNWMNKTVDTVAKLIAIMNGQTTYTRAKNQMIDYAKSLKTASKEAKGALASFDQLNVLQKNDSGEQSNGELTGADAFETVALTDADMEMYDAVKKKIEEIIAELAMVSMLLFLIGAGGPLAELMGKLMLIIGLVKFVKSYFDAWNNGISFDNLKEQLEGLTMIVIGMGILFGPTAAGLALLAGSVAMVVLAIKDMIENGVNAQNCLTLAIGVVAALVAVFLLFGSTAAVIVGAVAAVIAVFATLIAIAGNGEEAIATLKSMCGNFANFFKKLFAGDIKGALESLKNALRDVVNFGAVIVESMVKCVIKATNWIIDKINGIKIDMPEWVTKATGVTAIGFNLPRLPESAFTIPRLAEGAVIQGGKPFAAILGDQRFGQTNIETPLSTMVEAFKQAIAECGGTGGQYTIVAQLNGKTLFEETVRQSQMYYKATGKNAYIR